MGAGGRSREEEFMDPLESSLADLIWARSEGDPMVAIEEVRLLIQSRQVERRQGRWGAAGPIDPERPDDYSAFIRTRLDLLTPEDRDALAIAAVIRRSFDPKIAAALQRRDLLETLEALDRVAHDHKLLRRMVSGTASRWRR